jgi:energy-coupling factor transporter ATP-binding protein EcfA2
LDRGLKITDDSFVFIIVSSGVGKSTFINCLRGLEAEDQGSASVGVVETTNQPTPYEHPDFPNLKIWDLPGTHFFLFDSFEQKILILGVGTPNYPRSCYLEKIQFERYDFFLILCRTRFTGNLFENTIIKSFFF